MPALRALILMFVAIQSVATSSSDTADLSDVFVPGPKVAGAGDSWSLYTNPSGISFIDGAQFVGGYAYRMATFDHGRHLASGIVGLSIIEGLTVGFGLQLSLPQSQIGDDQGLLGGAIGLAYRFGRAFSMGGRVAKYRQYKNTSGDPFLLGFGIESFPTSWLSIGASVGQVYDDVLSKPDVRLGVAVRPFSEMLTISAESLFRPNDPGFNTNFSVNPEIAARLDLGGFSALASARFNDVTSAFTSPTIFAGLEFNFDHLGFGAVAKGHPSDNAATGGRFRLSSETWPSLAPKRERIVSLSIDHKGLAANQPLNLKRRLFGPTAQPVEVLDKLSSLSIDDSVSTVLLRLAPFDFGFGRAEELRNAVLDLRKHGKKTRVHFDSANAATFFVATAADEIFMSPSGEIDLDDFRTSLVYFHDALTNIGVNVQAITAGRYKSAPDMFTKNQPTPEVLEVRNAILDNHYSTFVSALSTFTKKDVGDLRKMIDLGAVSADEAKELGLVNNLLYLDEMGDDIPVYQNAKYETRWGDRCAMAVIPIKGMIVSGHVQPVLLNLTGPRAGAQDIIENIEEASNDTRVCAIILRIDSPGGDALASNLIYHALLNAKKKKPIVASIADMGASGAYYIAAASDEIFAPSASLTGSIGVFSLIPSAGGLANKLGVTHYEIQKAKNPGSTLLRGLTATEAARKQKLIDYDYDLFKRNVAKARNLDDIAVEKAAQGHVWTGAQALNLKLIDKVGGFSDAISSARRHAGLSVTDRIDLKLMGAFAPPLFPMPRLVGMLDGRSMALSTFSGDFLQQN